MSNESVKNLDNEVDKKEYSQPILTDYGKMSELTKTDATGANNDAGTTPSSYIS